MKFRTSIFLLISIITSCAKPSISFQTAINKADSCYMAQDYTRANYYYKLAFAANDAAPQDYHYSNAASVASMAGDEQTAFLRLDQLISTNKEWYSSNFATNPDYEHLHNFPQWQIFRDTVEARQERIERNYDKALIARLQAIYERDQKPRHDFLFAYKTNSNERTIDSLVHEMQRADSMNLIEIQDILQIYGFPSKAIVGTNNSVIWLVIQHSDVEYQKTFYPMLRKAAEQGEISWDNIALLEDRINMFEGRPQKYGSQVVKDSAGERVIYTLLNRDSVDIWRSAVGLNPLDEYAKQMDAKW